MCFNDFWITAFFLSTVLVANLPMVRCAAGTTPNIGAIFVGRCLDYKEIRSSHLPKPEIEDCAGLWTTFTECWAGKDPGSVTKDDYQPFIDATQQTDIPSDKILLWSGAVYNIARQYANNGQRYTMFEDLLVGYLVSGLTWCGQQCEKLTENCTGINYDTCPDDPNPFWELAYGNFAAAVKGSVRYLVTGTDGSKQPAYSKESHFAKYELPNLPKESKPIIILVNEIGKKTSEHCDMGSLETLQTDMESQQFLFRCEENPADIRHLLCMGHSGHRGCNFAPPNEGERKGGGNRNIIETLFGSRFEYDERT